MRKTGSTRRVHLTPDLNVSVLAAALLSSLLFLYVPEPALAQTAPQAQIWQLPAGPLDVALRRMAAQARLTISYSPDLVAGRTTHGVSGQHTPAEALKRLLMGTGLTLDAVDEETFALRTEPEPQPSRRHPATEAQSRSEEEQGQHVADLERVSVTGTRIRGAQPSSPLLLVTNEEMRLAGHNNLGEVIRAIPQNFSGGQNPAVQTGATPGGASNQNITGGSSLNLRGLGPDATLTLLNGARLPYDGFTQATDAAVIPVAAIERVEVLLDGASALYGADAVGGVANIILKRDFDGAELMARYGQATAGGYEQTQFSAVVGHSWKSGSLLLAGETSSTGKVLAEQRNYLSYISHPELVTIHPSLSQDGVLLSGWQRIGERVELELDAFLSKRSMQNRILTTVYQVQDTKSEVYGLSPSLRISLPSGWLMNLQAFTGQDDVVSENQRYNVATGLPTTRSRPRYKNNVDSLGVEFEGGLFQLGVNEVRASIGGGWRRTDFAEINEVTGATNAAGERSNRYIYGEIELPIISSGQAVPWVNRLSINGAARYEDYDTFSSTTTPKLGVLWSAWPGLDIRASWGKSFKVPTLLQSYQAQLIYLFAAHDIGGAAVGAPSDAQAIMLFGGNPNLGPEKADTLTAGVSFTPQALPDLNLEVGYFDIDYRERVALPIAATTQALSNPAYAEVVTSNPSATQISDAFALAGYPEGTFFFNAAGAAYDPARVFAIINGYYTNVAADRIKGIDLSVRYGLDLFGGRLGLNAQGSWIASAKRKLTSQSPETTIAGVTFFPARLKARVGASWSLEDLTISSYIYHVGGVSDSNVNPMVDRGSMTTLDLAVDYQLVTHGIGLNLSFANLFNKRPPFMEPVLPYQVNYDSTNYSALGRVVSLSITKKF